MHDRGNIVPQRMIVLEVRIMWRLRRVLSGLDTQQALETLTGKIRETSSNAEFLMLINKTTLGSKNDA